MKITVEMVMAEIPCEDYPPERVAELWAGRESLAPTEVVKLDIPMDDRVWILGRLIGRHDPTRVVARRIVRHALGDAEIPEAYQRWLCSGDRLLMRAAKVSAGPSAWATLWPSVGPAIQPAVWVVTWAPPRILSRNITWVAARVAASATLALETYAGWMVEFLEGVE